MSETERYFAGTHTSLGSESTGVSSEITLEVPLCQKPSGVLSASGHTPAWGQRARAAVCFL